MFLFLRWRDGAMVGGMGALVLGGMGCNHPFQAVSIYPIYAYEDGCTPVRIAGASFEEDGFKVAVDGQEVEHTWPDSEATPLDVGYAVSVYMPPHATGNVAVEVTSGGETQAIPGGFTYVPCDGGLRVDGAYLVDADYNGLDYASLAGGETLLVYGCGLGANTAVSIGGTPAEILFADCTTYLEVAVPAGAAYGSAVVSLTNDAGVVNEDVVVDYNCDVPTLEAIDPMYLDFQGGTVATAFGCGFYDDGVVHTTAYIDVADAAQDPMGGTPVEATVWDPYTLELIFPAHDPGQVALTVVNPDPADVTGATPWSFSTSPSPLEYVVPTSIAALAPDTGASSGGYVVEIYGGGFFEGTTVWWGGVAVPESGYTIVSDTRITIASAPGALDETGMATVSVAHPTGGQADFTFYYIDDTP